MSSTFAGNTSDASDVVILEDNNQLKKLAKLLYNNEAPLMANITSELERAKYIKQCSQAYNNAIGLLEEANNMYKSHEQEGDQAKTSIARDIVDYVKYGLNMCLQNIRNCFMRVTCIDKIKTHYTSLVDELTTLDTANPIDDVQRLAEDVTQAKQCMREYALKCRSDSARVRSKEYSKFLKQEGIKFPDLINRHKNLLGFETGFEGLDELKKLEVYNSIITESGRIKFPKLGIVQKAVGVAVLVVTASILVWDIFTAEHKLEAALSNTLKGLVEVGTFAVQIVVGGAVSQMAAQAGAGVVVIGLAGFVAATLAGLVFAAVSGFLIEQIFASGGNAAPSLDGLKFHTAIMPDGMAFALQIVRRG